MRLCIWQWWTCRFHLGSWYMEVEGRRVAKEVWKAKAFSHHKLFDHKWWVQKAVTRTTHRQSLHLCCRPHCPCHNPVWQWAWVWVSKEGPVGSSLQRGRGEGLANILELNSHPTKLIPPIFQSPRKLQVLHCSLILPSRLHHHTPFQRSGVEVGRQDPQKSKRWPLLVSSRANRPNWSAYRLCCFWRLILAVCKYFGVFHKFIIPMQRKISDQIWLR